MRTHFLVLAHERPESLERLLASIRTQRATSTAVDITVMDNASREPHGRLLEQSCRGFGARYVRSETNVFMKGKRLLEDLAFDAGTTPEIIVHLDDDVVLSSGWLGEVTRALRAGPFVACGSVEEWQGELVYSGQRELHLHTQQIAERSVRLWEWQWQVVDGSSGVVPVEFAGHRALAVRGDVATHIRHDAEYRIGGEDLDYSLELRRLGSHSIGIATNAVIEHRAHGEQDAQGFRTPHNIVGSWRHFYDKWNFLRANACAEAGMTLEGFVNSVVQFDPVHESMAGVGNVGMAKDG